MPRPCHIHCPVCRAGGDEEDFLSAYLARKARGEEEVDLAEVFEDDDDDDDEYVPSEEDDDDE